MAKFISILILLLWAAAAAAAVLLFKKKGKRARLLCAGALILCIVLLAAYYFPEKGLIPADAEVSYTEMLSPLPNVPAECDAAAGLLFSERPRAVCAVGKTTVRGCLACGCMTREHALLFPNYKQGARPKVRPLPSVCRICVYITASPALPPFPLQA